VVHVVQWIKRLLSVDNWQGLTDVICYMNGAKPAKPLTHVYL
jgi:hypothetical protein